MTKIASKEVAGKTTLMTAAVALIGTGVPIVTSAGTDNLTQLVVGALLIAVGAAIYAVKSAVYGFTSEDDEAAAKVAAEDAKQKLVEKVVDMAGDQLPKEIKDKLPATK